MRAHPRLLLCLALASPHVVGCGDDDAPRTDGGVDDGGIRDDADVLDDGGPDGGPPDDDAGPNDAGVPDALRVERIGGRLRGRPLALSIAQDFLWVGTSTLADPSNAGVLRGGLGRLDLARGTLDVIEDALPRVGDGIDVGPASTAEALTIDGTTYVVSQGGLLAVEGETVRVVPITDAAGEPLTMALSPDSAEPDAGVRYLVSYAIGEDGSGEFSVIRRQPGMDDEPVDNLVFDPDTGTLNFDNAEGETVSFDVGGVPQNGDQAEIFVASRDIFANMAVLIDSLERPGPSVMADGPVAFGLDSFDMGLESVLRVRAQVGSQMSELENLGTVGTDQGLQYASEISRLEDLDYAEAISRLSQQQIFLEAAQQTYLRVTGLSLFNFLS